MKYKRSDDCFYLRVEKGEEIISCVKSVCLAEKIFGGEFSGIGGCDNVTVSTYVEDRDDFVDHNKTGMLELVSLCGNISQANNGEPFLHAHAIFSFLDSNEIPRVLAGHVKQMTVSYTGEIIIKPASFNIGRMTDDKAGISVWDI